MRNDATYFTEVVERREQDRNFLTSLSDAYPHLVTKPAEPKNDNPAKKSFTAAQWASTDRLRKARLASFKVNVPISTSILHAVCDWFNVEMDELTSRRRSKRITSARFVAYRLLRDVTFEDGAQRFSYPQIGHLIGGRDHSTVIHGCETFHDRARAFPEMLEAYRDLSV